MNTTLITWVLCFLGVLVYFLIKARKISLDMAAANESFDFIAFLKTDWFDILIALGGATLFLTTGSSIPGIPIDFSSGLASFTTGVGIASVGVNVILGVLGLGDKSRKKVRNTVDTKTGKRNL